MAARKSRIQHDEYTRKKIQTTQLINRLTAHALGEVEMTSSQVRAAEVLIKKTLPDLTAATIEADVMTQEVTPLTAEEAKKLNDKLEDEC